MFQDLQSPKPKKCASLIKIFTIVTSVMLIAFGILGFVFMAANSIFEGKIFLIFSPIFIILFGVLLGAAQFHIKIITKRFGFLNSMLGRGFFNLYAATEVYFYFACGDQNILLAWLGGLTLFVLGIVNIGIHFLAGSNTYATDVRKQFD